MADLLLGGKIDLATGDRTSDNAILPTGDLTTHGVIIGMTGSGKTGLGVYADGMVEHDGLVGQLLAKVKELGIEDNTIVMYSTDNGAEAFTWPDGGTTMFRGEKNTQWEGGYRVPCAIRWPGVIKPGTVINDIGAHEDMLTTLCAAAGDATAKEDLKKGRRIGDRTYKVHLDGHDLEQVSDRTLRDQGARQQRRRRRNGRGIADRDVAHVADQIGDRGGEQFLVAECWVWRQHRSFAPVMHAALPRVSPRRLRGSSWSYAATGSCT